MEDLIKISVKFEGLDEELNNEIAQIKKTNTPNDSCKIVGGGNR